jgi:Domain of unknown function (DUF4350)
MSDSARPPAVASATRSGTGRRLGIAAIAFLGAVIALNLLARGLDRAIGGSEPSGVAGSSYGTQDTGLAAAAALFTHYGHPVSRRRGTLTGAALDPAATVFVIEPQSLTDDDDATLLDFVSQGGRLVIGGSDPFYLRRLRDRPPRWTPDGSTSYLQFDPTLGVRRVAAAGSGSWADRGSGTVLAHADEKVLLTADRVGRGEILFLADPSPLENAYLARADNAAFTLALAGNAARPVEFDEGTHGYGEARGFGAIPGPWKISLLVLAAAAVVIAWSRSRRLGPPDRGARELPPARGEYVRALAVTLERTRDPGTALAPMQQWARSHIARRAHLRSDASPEEIDRAAILLGCSESERAAMWYPTTDDNTALALGRLVSRLSHEERSRA